MKIGNREFDTRNNTYIMGILNITPDSFSDGGKHLLLEAAVKRAKEMIEEGVDIIDVGGESTRPGYKPISEEEEIGRVIPVIEAIKKISDIPISIDTYKSHVAKEAIFAGADMVNEIWGLKKDPLMGELIADKKVACCLMHNRTDMVYNDFLKDIFQEIEDIITYAERAGIQSDKIILDPGIGFAKNYEMNIKVLRSMDVFHQFGYPLLLAASRKSVIGETLDLPEHERIEGTLVTTVLAVSKKYSFVRVHDIKENKRAIKMAKMIM